MDKSVGYTCGRNEAKVRAEEQHLALLWIEHCLTLTLPTKAWLEMVAAVLVQMNRCGTLEHNVHA